MVAETEYRDRRQAPPLLEAVREMLKVQFYMIVHHDWQQLNMLNMQLATQALFVMNPALSAAIYPAMKSCREHHRILSGSLRVVEGAVSMETASLVFTSYQTFIYPDG